MRISRKLAAICSILATFAFGAKAWALRGGADGGGGNTLEERPLTAQELKWTALVLPAYVEKILFYQRSLFEQLGSTSVSDRMQFESSVRTRDQAYFAQGMIANHIDNVDIDELRKVDYPLLLATHRKMFTPADGRPPIERLIGEIEFKLNPHGPCVDLQNRPRDGASLRKQPTHEICLSFDRLRKKLNRRNFIPQLLSLAVHELSHRMGTTEIEAINLQRVVEATVRQPTLDALYFFVRNDVNTTLDSQLKEARQVLEPEPFEPLRFCGQLINLASSTRSVDESFRTGAIAKPLKAYKLREIANQQFFSALIGFCNGKHPPAAPSSAEMLSIRPDTPNSPGLTLDEGFRDYRPGRLGDREAARFNLDQIIKNFELADRTEGFFILLRQAYDVRRMSDFE